MIKQTRRWSIRDEKFRISVPALRDIFCHSTEAAKKKINTPLSPGARDAVRLVFIKLTGLEEEKVFEKVIAPFGVPESEWVCFLGPVCQNFKSGYGCVNINQASFHITQQGQGSVPVFDTDKNCRISYQFYNSSDDKNNSLEFLSLLPLREKDSELIQKEFNILLDKELTYFSCPAHFENRNPVTKRIVGSSKRSSLLIEEPQRQGDLKVPKYATSQTAKTAVASFLQLLSSQRMNRSLEQWQEKENWPVARRSFFDGADPAAE